MRDSKGHHLGAWVLIVIGDGVVCWAAIQVLLVVHQACKALN